MTLKALEQMGARVEDMGDDLRITGRAGRLAPCAEPVYLENSGTSMRLLTAIAALGQGKYTLTGTERMAERPIEDLLDALSALGISARSVRGNGCPPVEVTGAPVVGGCVDIRCAVSSQYLSGLLLMAPCTRIGMDIRVTQGPVSRPYVDMTLEVMENFGIEVRRRDYTDFSVPGGQAYAAGTYAVAPDASQAGYFWAAAAVTGATVRVAGTHTDSRQGDVRLAEVFRTMGCAVDETAEGIAVTGGPGLSGVHVDMADMPDMVPTLAVVAAFARGDHGHRKRGPPAGQGERPSRCRGRGAGAHGHRRPVHGHRAGHHRRHAPRRRDSDLRRPPHRHELCRGRPESPRHRHHRPGLRGQILSRFLGGL